jgi:gluconate 2-dehydrogenase gamma chain
LTSLTKSRRDFLKIGGSAIGASWLAANTPLLLAATETAQKRQAEQAAYVNISQLEALELSAIVDQIIPPDETPGATEIGVVYFIDAALGTFRAVDAPILRDGLEQLKQKSASDLQAGGRFSELPFEKQTSILEEIEDTRFFKTVYSLTIMGMFCLPQYSGNRGNMGWDLLGFDHRHAWQPPFGHYDMAAHGQDSEKGDDRGNS